MTNYYIEQDSKIVLFDTDKTKLENTLKFMPQYRGLPILETQRPIIDYQFADTEQYINKELSLAKQAKLNEASNKAFEYRDKTGTVSFDGRPVEPIMPMTEGEEPPATITVHTELLNQDDMFQRVIGFQQGIFTQDQIYNTKEDIPVYLNAQEAQAVYFAIVARAQKLWVQDYMTYKSMIEACTTAEEVNAIVIDYDNVPVIQEPEAPEEPAEETTEDSSDVEEEHENKPDKTTPDTGVQEVQEDTAGEIE